MNVIFTCGGTAGHINPALALAGIFRSYKPETNILFVGAAGPTMETTLVPRAGYDLKTVNVNSFRRKFNWDGICHNCKALRNIGISRKQAGAIIDDFKPDLVVGTGGFASYPLTREAARRGIATALHESNALPGLTTQRLARHVDCVMVGFEDSRSHYPHPERVVVTGTPVRPDFFTHTRREARAALGLTDHLPLVLSYWGSLGATAMNRQMTEVFALEVQANAPFHHIHGAGEWYHQEMHDDLKKRGIDLEDHPNYTIEKYIYDMPLVMAAADLVLCRAGASTISELTALAKPGVLVPSPNVTGDHQTKNAKLLADRGGVLLLPERDCTPQVIFDTLVELLHDKDRRHAMGVALSAISPPDATQRIYETLLNLMRG